MRYPDHVLTAPPSKRSPVRPRIRHLSAQLGPNTAAAHQHPAPRNNPQDPGESWDAFLQSVESKCGPIDYNHPGDPSGQCWYQQITSVDGRIPVPCDPSHIDSACAASVLSTASVIYTRLYPDDVSPTSASPSPPVNSPTTPNSPPLTTQAATTTSTQVLASTSQSSQAPPSGQSATLPTESISNGNPSTSARPVGNAAGDSSSAESGKLLRIRSPGL